MTIKSGVELTNAEHIEVIKQDFKNALISLETNIDFYRYVKNNSNKTVHVVIYNNALWFYESHNTYDMADLHCAKVVIESDRCFDYEETDQLYSTLIQFSKDNPELYQYFTFKVNELESDEAVIDANIKKQNMKHLLDAKVISKASKWELHEYIESCHIFEYSDDSLKDYFNAEYTYLERIDLEVIYEDTDDQQKYGSQTIRIMLDKECVGVITRSGKYLDEKEYYTFDKVKWDDMIETIIKESGAKKECKVQFIDVDSDMYNEIKLHGWNREEYQEYKEQN